MKSEQVALALKSVDRGKFCPVRPYDDSPQPIGTLVNLLVVRFFPCKISRSRLLQLHACMFCQVLSVLLIGPLEMLNLWYAVDRYILSRRFESL